MIRNTLLSLLVMTAIGFVAWQMTGATPPSALINTAIGGNSHPSTTSSTDDHPDHEEHSTDSHENPMGEIPKGPKGGKWFEHDGFAIELVLYESGVPPEFHAYPYLNGQLLSPEAVDLAVELSRLGNRVDRIGFKPLKQFLRGQDVVAEPHSFDVRISASHAGKRYEWRFSSYEGRTEIPAELAQEAGIETEVAASTNLHETIDLTGRVQADPARIAKVWARFPGMVLKVHKNLGEPVRKGEVLARVQSNESLQAYSVKSPIDGLILRRDVQSGSNTGDEPLFVIADLSRVWVELDVFGRNLGRIDTGQPVRVRTLDGDALEGHITFISPLALHASQSVQARVVLDNSDGRLRPGQFVRGLVTVAEHPVDLAVRQSGIQRFRDFQVVFARIGDSYEVRMLELGRQNGEWVEVLGGLEPGTEYVTANSYLIKADVEKSGASHDH
ncbi:MAG: efflux RND transporter periplasmic adaptor subunit [Candidatus Thiodiazotropha sp. (ex Monitilora ramsayi)]|nr:efflux RND transporter periplasmic adaptor subunit [Candidatus Thiodiazotropha sp. (ex Monitilora ramsayi)]